MLTVRIDGIDKLIGKLSNVSKEIDNPVLLDEAAALVFNRIRARFLDESGPTGKWPESKAAHKRKTGGFTTSHGKKWTGTGTLFASGTLFHSLQLAAIDESTRAIKTDVPYAPLHQLGLGQEKRVFLGFNEEDALLVGLLTIKRLEAALQS